MSSKTRTGLFQTPVSKPSPTTPKSKLGSSASLKSDADSPSPNPRFSIDRASPKTVTSRPVSRSSSRVSTPDKSQPRINKPSELQSQLQAAQDDLKKAKEKLILSEKEKIQAINDLKDAKKLADEANEKLQRALVAQKQAEESSEIDKFRALELEQAGIETAQNNEEWKKHLEELKRVKQELAMVNETKNQALAHADDATRIAEIHAEKAEFLSAELARLKCSDQPKAEGKEFSEERVVVELRCELGLLKEELKKSKSLEQELLEKEESHEKNMVGLKMELESLREELDKAKACEQGVVEEPYERIVAELASREQDLKKAKICEEDLIEKQKFYEKTTDQLKSNLDFLQQDLEKAKTSEQYLVDREKSHDDIVCGLKLEIDSLRKELEKAERSEQKLSETVMGLNSETNLLKQELEKVKSMEEEMIEREKSNKKIVSDLESELHSLKPELQVAKICKEKLTETESSYELMNVELEAAKMAEFYALNSLGEWKRKAEELECKVEETTRLERSASHSLESVKNQLQEAECEVVCLKEKVALLEISLVKGEEDLEESKSCVRKANEEAEEAAKVIESLTSELENVKEEKAQAQAQVRDLLEENNNRINELETLKEEEEKNRMAMESLTCALHEVSAEAREAKERLLISQDEHLNFEAMLEDSKREIDRLTNTVGQSKIDYDTQMEDLKVDLKASKDKYESMLDAAKQECDHLTEILGKSEVEIEIKKAEWEAKELKLMDDLKKSEENKSYMEKEMIRLMQLLREAEEKASSFQKERSQLKLEASCLNEALEEVKTSCLKLKEDFRGKESELERTMKENEQLRAQEKSNVWRIDELTKLLEEAKAHHPSTENGELSDIDKDYDLLPKVVNYSEENGVLGAEKEFVTGMSNGVSRETFQTGAVHPEEVDRKPTVPENKEKLKDEGLESEAKMWESYKVDREFSTEMETEQGSLDDEVESKADNGESLDHNGNPSENGLNPDSKPQKKKKALYRKFGNLLKKGISSPK
ncbi:WEB family protein At3g02930, chloroplastic-like [Silene latifolia]|uniref:WEB family protein At3g02930, chloroplastic-like n=1 Tax=Silene latifolia TaxID=37657 RepID=UPI003D78073D